MYERKHHQLLTRARFRVRVFQHLVLAVIALTFGLGIGVLGYHFLGTLSWVDSLLNASMILGGMGPVNPLETDTAKIFASCYALFSGLVFIGIATLIIAPFAHRLLHRFHLDEDH